MSSFTRGPKPNDIGKEFDNTDRSVQVTFFKAPVEGIDSDKIEYSHHGLCFEFEGGRDITVEGTQDDNGYLVPMYTNGLPVENASGYPLMKMKLSPKRVWECVKHNSLNNTLYSLTTNNCQHWLREFSKLLSSELAMKIHQQYPTLLEAQPNLHFIARIERKKKQKKASSRSFKS